MLLARGHSVNVVQAMMAEDDVGIFIWCAAALLGPCRGLQAACASTCGGPGPCAHSTCTAQSSLPVAAGPIGSPAGLQACLGMPVHPSPAHARLQGQAVVRPHD